MPLQGAVLSFRSKIKRYANVLGEVVKQKLCFNFVKLGCRHCAKEATWSSCCRDYRHLFLPLRNVAASRWERWPLILFFFLRLLAAERNVTLFVPREFKIDISFTPIGIYAIVFDVSFVMSLQRRYKNVLESHMGRVEGCRASGRRRWKKRRL